MPPRRGRGRGKYTTPTKKEQSDDNAAETLESPGGNAEITEDAVKKENGGVKEEPMDATPVQATSQQSQANGEKSTDAPSEVDTTYPYQIKVTHMPETYNYGDFLKYIASTFKVLVPKIVSPQVNSPWVLLCFCDQKQQSGLLVVLDHHVWRKKTLRAVSHLPLENRKRKLEDGEDEQDLKKPKSEEEAPAALTIEQEILSESLPLLNVSYEQQKFEKKSEKPWMTAEILVELEKTKKLGRLWKSDFYNKILHELYKAQRNISSKLVKNNKAVYEYERVWLVDLSRFNENRLSRQDAELMAQRLHGLLCNKNPDLAGWAEKSCEENDGNLFQIEPLRVCTAVHGYRNKCKLRIGKNAEGQTTVGFCLNDNENKILAVEPGDKFIHLPDSMKYAAKKFQDMVRGIGYEPYEKKKKSGTWDNLLIRVAPDGALMLIAIVSPSSLTDQQMAKLKEDMKTFFTTGDGQDCNVFSLYLQVLQDHHPIHPLEKLELLSGKPDYEENICELKFYVSPFSILNINPSSSENIYNSVIELAQPTPQHVVIDVCAGSCGIAFTFANKVEKAYAIEPQEENVRDALKTKALNNITNVEIIKGKCEDHLEKLFEKLKEQPLIVVLDPPRHGVVSKIIAQIRAQPNVEKVVYVCSNTKTGVKNFLDLCAKEGRDNNSGQVMTGLPFLPVRGIPIDVAPYTVNNTVPLLLKRIDPSTYPPATKPPPAPINKEVSKKKPGARRRQDMGRGGRGNRGPLRGVRGGGVRGMRGRGGGGPGSYQSSPFMRPPPRPLMGRRMMPGDRYSDANNIINKYERRIAEMEQQDRAFKAGLSMGLQAANRGGGGAGGGGMNHSNNSRNMGDYSTGEAFGGYRGGYKDPYGNGSGSGDTGGPGPWQSHSTSNSGFGYSLPDFTADSFGSTPPMPGGGGGGYGAHAAFGHSHAGGRSKPPLSGSRFIGMGGSGGGGRGSDRAHRGGGGGKMRGGGGGRGGRR